MTIFEFLKRHELRLRIPQRNDFGLRVSDCYRENSDEAPPKVEQQEGPHLFQVRDYPETFERQMMVLFNEWSEASEFGRRLRVPDEGEQIKAARVVLRRKKKPEPSENEPQPIVRKRKRIVRGEQFSSPRGSEQE